MTSAMRHLLCLVCVVFMQTIVVFRLAFPPYVNEDEEEQIIAVLKEFPDDDRADDDRDEGPPSQGKKVLPQHSSEPPESGPTHVK